VNTPENGVRGGRKTKYQLIAVDIDGTLLNSRKEILPETREAIRRVCAAGKTVVFDTGRAVCELEELFDRIPEVRYAVFASGAGLYDGKERQAFSLRGIPEKEAREILALVRAKDVMPQIVLADRDVIQASHMARLDDFHMGIYRPMYEKAMTLVPDIYAFAAACREPFLKLNLYHRNPAERLRTLEQVTHLDLEKVFSEVTSLECSAKGVNKGNGLLELCEVLHISPEACIAVGDANNDLPMIRTAGLGIAMGNAPEDIRREADRVVRDLDHGGCAEAILYLLE